MRYLNRNKEMIATKLNIGRLAKAYDMVNSLTKIHTMDILKVVYAAKHPISQMAIASSLGLTPQDISQTLQHMRKSGIIDYAGSNSRKTYKVNYAKIQRISEAVKRFN